MPFYDALINDILFQQPHLDSMIDHILIIFNILSFTAYGFSCLKAKSMRREFRRYGLAKFRVVNGLLQLAAALGLTIGLIFPPLLVFASGGLALQMLAGIIVRRRIQDSWLQCFPALIYCVLNTFLVFRNI